MRIIVLITKDKNWKYVFFYFFLYFFIFINQGFKLKKYIDIYYIVMYIIKKYTNINYIKKLNQKF